MYILMLNMKLRKMIFYFCWIFLIFPLIILAFLTALAQIIQNLFQWWNNKLDNFYTWSNK